jgi:hypothetical protein
VFNFCAHTNPSEKQVLMPHQAVSSAATYLYLVLRQFSNKDEHAIRLETRKRPSMALGISLGHNEHTQSCESHNAVRSTAPYSSTIILSVGTYRYQVQALVVERAGNACFSRG